MLIGKLSSRDTIRYYEKVGLIKPSGYQRQANSYKNYSTQVLARLKQIIKLKERGFTLSEITQLLDSPNQESHPCSELTDKLSLKMAKLDEKIAILQKHRNSIEKIRHACNSQCTVIDGLPSCVACG